jgi:hypothetical protein
VKEKWIATPDLARGSLFSALPIGTRRLVDPIKCCISSSLR